MINNASFHKRPHLKTRIEKDGHILEYLPSYSTDLNPIEKKLFQDKSSRMKYQCNLETIFEKYIT
ncbi:transposase [Orientia tsutsugamushi]|uniref:transposase n=1 Tax=Orientia tsutsugamushi TaxID=784 RepID=UPI0035285D68